MDAVLDTEEGRFVLARDGEREPVLAIDDFPLGLGGCSFLLKTPDAAQALIS